MNMAIPVGYDFCRYWCGNIELCSNGDDEFDSYSVAEVTILGFCNTLGISNKATGFQLEQTIRYIEWKKTGTFYFTSLHQITTICPTVRLSNLKWQIMFLSSFSDVSVKITCHSDASIGRLSLKVIPQVF